MKSLILLLIAMSAAGTFPFIIYMALSTIFDNYISARFRYRCLKYCLLLYLVPFPLLKYFIYHRYFSTPKPLNGNVVISLTGKIVQTSTGFYLNSVGSLQKIFIGLWICSLSIIIFYKAINFSRFHRKISQNVLSDPEIIKIVEMLSQEILIIKIIIDTFKAILGLTKIPILFTLLLRKIRLFFENINVILDFTSERSFAYNPPTADLRSVPWTGFFDPAEGAQVSVFDNGNEIECITFEDESSMIPSDEIYFKDTENYFITDNGDIIIIEPGDIQTYAGCSHIFVNGKHKNHSRNKNGGCTVKTYKGKICTKCNYTKDFSLDSTVTYSPCPH